MSSLWEKSANSTKYILKLFKKQKAFFRNRIPDLVYAPHYSAARAEGIVSFKTELRVKKNGSHFKSRDLLVQRFTSSVSGSPDLFLTYTLCHVYSSKLVDHNCCKIRLDATRSISDVSKGFYPLFSKSPESACIISVSRNL